MDVRVRVADESLHSLTSCMTPLSRFSFHVGMCVFTVFKSLICRLTDCLMCFLETINAIEACLV